MTTSRSILKVSILCGVIVGSSVVVGCGGANDDGNNGGSGGGGGNTANPFVPSDLEDAVAALHEALQEAPPKLDDEDRPIATRVSMVANTWGTFWTAASIGTSQAASASGCIGNFDATTDGLPASQVELVNSKFDQGYDGVGVSAIDPDVLETSVDYAGTNERDIITFDSDTAADSDRPMYLGSINYEAGFAAGEEMVRVLNGAGKIALFAGFENALNVIERVNGVEDAIEGTDIEIVVRAYDEKDSDVARSNVEDAIEAHSDLAGIIGIYAYNGPIARQVLIEQELTESVKLVAFDLEPETLEGLADGTVAAALGQRPYWWGYLGVYILCAMDRVGQSETMTILNPWLSGDGSDLFSTGQDVVTPETLELYKEYLASLGISSS